MLVLQTPAGHRQSSAPANTLRELCARVGYAPRCLPEGPRSNVYGAFSALTCGRALWLRADIAGAVVVSRCGTVVDEGRPRVNTLMRDPNAGPCEVLDLVLRWLYRRPDLARLFGQTFLIAGRDAAKAVLTGEGYPL